MNVNRLIVAMIVLMTIVPVHAAYAVYDAGLGRWLSRDSLEYVDGPNMNEYAMSNPIVERDPSGQNCGTDSLDVWDSPYGNDFGPCCVQHDTCYASCGNRLACDQAWLACMMVECQVSSSGWLDATQCLQWAYYYYGS